jgi:hypothetical protein
MSRRPYVAPTRKAEVAALVQRTTFSFIASLHVIGGSAAAMPLASNPDDQSHSC